MTWLQRHRVRRFLASSLWLTPSACMAAALIVAPIVHRVDAAAQWTGFGFGPDGARALVAALVGAAFTCIVFVFTVLLVAVQIASTQLTPRIIAGALRNRATRACLGLFAFTLIYGPNVLGRIEATVPQISLAVAVALTLATLVVFLYLVSYLGHHLRPVAVLTLVGARAAAVVERIYPHRLVAPPTNGAPTERLAMGPAHTVFADQSGVMLAFDVAGLTALAAGGLIEVVPEVGDFVAKGDPLVRVYGAARTLAGRARDAIALGPERTMEQDPAFGFRIVVDIALKA